MESRTIETHAPGQTEPRRYRSIEIRAAVGELRDHPDRMMAITFADGSVMRVAASEIVAKDGSVVHGSAAVELREERIRLYASISSALHDTDELLMDAHEILTGGWTARDGDEDDRLYGAEAHEWIGARMPELLSRVGWARDRYAESGGSDPAVIADAEWTINEISKRIVQARAKAEEYSPERQAAAMAEEEARMEAYCTRRAA